jgi:2-C-methyl-D-erythritol 4-phosphate cytidylyltransferase/2-C-methyl-D-erythritol 2,4-cyclodiphosphate synthase
VVGGSTRFESVRHAFEAIPNANADDLVLIHDVARCFFHPGDLTEALKRTLDTGALIYAAQMTDTVKQVSNSDEQWLANTLDRQRLVRAQTPQIFRYGLLQEAYAHEDHSSDDVVTDEAQLVERLGHRVAFWCSPQKNEKLTFEEDFNMGFGPRVFVGHGFDVHAFAPDRSLFLCGIPIAAGPGLAGHSDADVALHALMDALLGAMGLGDIGEWFPDHDARWKDVRSTVLLQQVMQALREKGAVIGNVDLTIVAQTPKLSPFREDMKHSLATHLGVASEHINVKATTTEHLGFVGRKEGMACHAVVSLYRGVSSCNP